MKIIRLLDCLGDEYIINLSKIRYIKKINTSTFCIRFVFDTDHTSEVILQYNSPEKRDAIFNNIEEILN